MKIKTSKKIIILIAAVIVALGLSGFFAFQLLFSGNTAFDEKSRIVLIEHETEVQKLADLLIEQGIIDQASGFVLTSKFKRFNTAKPGRYSIKKNAGNNNMINMFRSGDQWPVTLRIDDTHDIYQLAGKLGKNLQHDSADFIQAFTKSKVVTDLGYNEQTLACLILPNTYDFFWTVDPEEFLKKMNAYFNEYWSESNIKRAEKIGMTPVQVCILASIVKAETAKKDESPKIAGLYMNRLRIGMALQSDPTAVFGEAVHSQRVYLSDLQNDSPYNTYRHFGLPPGPIDFAETSYLNAVLEYQHHDFLFMCAQPGGTGYHNFARTLDQHNVYRKEYTSWLEKRGVR